MALVAAGLLLEMAPLGAQGAPSPVALPARDVPLGIEVTPLFTLGEIDGPEWQSFGHVRAVDFGPDGDLFVLDQQARQVHRVARDGSYRGPVGRSGEGPGEYELPTGLVVAPDGRVLIRDTRRNAWVTFEADGEPGPILRPSAALGRPSDVDVGPDGTLYGTPNAISLVRGGRVVQSYRTESGSTPARAVPLLHFDAAGQSPTRMDELRLPPREAAGGRLLDVAFLPRPHWALLPDGRVAVVDSLDWRIRILDPARPGGPTRILVRNVEPIEVTASVREAELERRAALPNGGRTGGMVVFGGGSEEENSRAMERALRERLEDDLGFWPEIQVVRKLMVDPAGRLWIARGVPTGDGAAPGPVDVVSPDGRYLGTIPSFTLPDAVGPEGLAAWIETGEMDVPNVRVARIRLPGIG